MKKRNKPRYSLLLLLLLFISLGYALLQSNLNINGIVEIEDPKWDIHWDNVQIKEGSVSTSNANKATINSSKTIVSYNITLDKPGDFYEFTVDAVNEGTIDAMIDTISSKMNGTEITTLPEYLEYSVTYSDGVELLPNQELKIDTSEKYKVRIAFKKNINASQLPSEPVDLNMIFIVNYKQATDDAIEVEHPTTVYTVPFSSVRIGQEIPNSVTQFSSAEEAIDYFKEDMEDDRMNFCLKHTIVNEIVTESYIVFAIDSRIVAENPSAKAGIYEVKYSPPNTMNDNNMAIMQEAFGSNHCSRSQYGNSYNCVIYYGDTEFYVDISDNTSDSTSLIRTAITNLNTRCAIYQNGSSYCEQW